MVEELIDVGIGLFGATINCLTKKSRALVLALA
jgi:hypothetical protein